MDIYVITILEFSLDAETYASTYKKCSRTLAGAKKILKEAMINYIKEYEEEDVEWEIASRNEKFVQIDIDDGLSTTTLEIEKIKEEEPNEKNK